MQRKIIPYEDCAEVCAQLRTKGKLVHCHGTFDLLHPGHISHLEQAKGLGDILVVSLTSAPFVNKGPGRPVFNRTLSLRDTWAKIEKKQRG